MKIALEVHPEIRDLFGPDRRGALITVAAHIAHWLVLLLVVPAVDSVWWPVFLSLTVITQFYGVYYNQFHEGMHNLCWPTEFGSRVLDVICMGGTPFRGLADMVEMTRGHLRVHHARSFSPGDYDTNIYLYERPFDSDTVGAIQLLSRSPVQRMMPQVFSAAVFMVQNVMGLLISNPWRMVKHAVTGEGIPRPFRLPAWFFVAGWLYQMAFALLPAIAAAYLWPDRQITAALHVVLVNFLAETWQYLPMLPFTGGLVFNTLDHLLVKGDQPSFSIQNRVLYWLSVGFFYHMEHHDFARIPSWKLHKLASIAPEFYSQIEDFGALERLHAWVLKDWQHVELSKMGLILDELRAARRKMDLRIDFSGFTQPQYDRAVAIAKSMDVVVT